MGIPASNEILRKFLDYSQLHDTEELYFRVGLGILGPEDFYRILNEDALSKAQKPDEYYISTGDSGDRKYVMAECCSPIPGDPVIGFLSADGSVTIHKKSCVVAESLASKYGDRVIVPKWLISDKEYPIRISLKGIDRVGLLSDISSFISQTLGINMRKLQLSTDEGVFEGYIELLVKDKRNLDNMVTGLNKIKGIQDVVRTDI